MSTGSAAAIKKIKSWKGLKEGPAVDKAIINPWNKVMKRNCKSKTTPWCAITVASCFIQIGKSAVTGYSKSAGCKQQKAYYVKYKRFIKKGQRPAAGYVIFLNDCKHEGLVTSTSANGTGKYIAGNTSDMVKECSFNWKTAKNVVGYGKPLYK